MREVCRTIHAEQSLVTVEPEIAPLEDVFHLADARELEDAKQRYLAAGPETRAVVLAATRGAGLGDLTADRPKCMPIRRRRGRPRTGSRAPSLSNRGSAETGHS